MTSYYNEIDKKAAAWLRELIAEGLIAPGDVDERSITDVDPNELAGYRQLHFFAGVGGWAIAARLAGWPDDREIVTGSCPCQPFSVAGKGAGTADARHLWPDFFRIIRARRPACVMGEQVAAAVGKDWLLGVRTDMEGIGYAGRGIVVPACAVNAPHRRDRLWFAYGSSVVGDLHDQGPQGYAGHEPDGARRPQSLRPIAAAGRSDCGALEHSSGIGRGEGRPEPGVWSGRSAAAGAGLSLCDVADTQSDGLQGRSRQDWRQDARSLSKSRMDIAGASESVDAGGIVAITDLAERRPDLASGDNAVGNQAGRNEITGDIEQRGAWSSAKWLICHDGKARRVEPSIPLLVDGIPARAPLLRGYGNAIVPQIAAEMMAAWLEEFPATPGKAQGGKS